jgi:hypothetical protein
VTALPARSGPLSFRCGRPTLSVIFPPGRRTCHEDGSEPDNDVAVGMDALTVWWPAHQLRIAVSIPGSVDGGSVSLTSLSRVLTESGSRLALGCAAVGGMVT